MGEGKALPDLYRAVYQLCTLLPAVLDYQPILVEGVAEVLGPFHPGERPSAQLERLWTGQLTSPRPHHVDGFALAAGRVLVCAELDVVCITELLTRLEHQLCSMPTWRKQDDVIRIPNYTHVYTCHMAAYTQLSQHSEKRIHVNVPEGWARH